MSRRRDTKVAAGMPIRHNEPQIDRLPDRVSRLEWAMQHVATKEDIADIRSDINKALGEQDAKFEKRFGEQNANFEKRFGEMDAKMEKGFGDLRTEIKASSNRLLYGGLGLAGAMFVGLGGMIYSNQSSTNAALDRMDRRIEASEQARDRRFEEMNQAMDRRFEAIDRRFESMDRRFERLEQILLLPRSEVEARLPAAKSPSG